MEENTYIGRAPLAYSKKWWSGQQSEAKGGSFNMEHYLRVVDAKEALLNGASAGEYVEDEVPVLQDEVPAPPRIGTFTKLLALLADALSQR